MLVSLLASRRLSIRCVVLGFKRSPSVASRLAGEIRPGRLRPFPLSRRFRCPKFIVVPGGGHARVRPTIIVLNPYNVFEIWRRHLKHHRVLQRLHSVYGARWQNDYGTGFDDEFPVVSWAIRTTERVPDTPVIDVLHLVLPLMVLKTQAVPLFEDEKLSRIAVRVRQPSLFAPWFGDNFHVVGAITTASRATPVVAKGSRGHVSARR